MNSIALEWKIAPKGIPIPTVDYLPFTNSEQSPASDEKLMSQCQIASGVSAATEVGSYDMNIIPNSNHCWEDTGTSEARPVTWEIIKSGPLNALTPSDISRLYKTGRAMEFLNYGDLTKYFDINGPIGPLTTQITSIWAYPIKICYRLVHSDEYGLVFMLAKVFASKIDNDIESPEYGTDYGLERGESALYSMRLGTVTSNRIGNYHLNDNDYSTKSFGGLSDDITGSSSRPTICMNLKDQIGNDTDSTLGRDAQKYGPNKGGWERSYARIIADDFYNALPPELQECIVTSQVWSDNVGNGYDIRNGGLTMTLDKVFIPDIKEVNGDTSGVQAYFAPYCELNQTHTFSYYTTHTDKVISDGSYQNMGFDLSCRPASMPFSLRNPAYNDISYFATCISSDTSNRISMACAAIPTGMKFCFRIA